jgi:hypothetical protein
MNNAQAREILRRYRPGVGEDQDTEMSEALTQIKHDPELRSWFDQQQAFTAQVRHQLGRIEPPTYLRARILRGRRSLPVPAWWRRPGMLALAAGFALLICWAGFWLPHRAQNTLSLYRVRMAKVALREYDRNMDLVSTDLEQIRNYLRGHGAPADYELGPTLEKLPGMGCALLKWQNQPVSLVCFQLNAKNPLWLFVIDRNALPDAPATAEPEYAQVGKLATATWTRQGRTYLLACVGDPQQLKQYL